MDLADMLARPVDGPPPAPDSARARPPEAPVPAPGGAAEALGEPPPAERTPPDGEPPAPTVERG